jgi:hypothetical protein
VAKEKKRMRGERKEALMRIVVAIVTGVILYLWGYVIIFATILNWLIALIAAKRSQGLADFCEYWNSESYKFYRYITGVSNSRPFPFTSIERISEFEK